MATAREVAAANNRIGRTFFIDSGGAYDVAYGQGQFVLHTFRIVGVESAGGRIKLTQEHLRGTDGEVISTFEETFEMRGETLHTIHMQRQGGAAIVADGKWVMGKAAGRPAQSLQRCSTVPPEFGRNAMRKVLALAEPGVGGRGHDIRGVKLGMHRDQLPGEFRGLKVFTPTELLASHEIRRCEKTNDPPHETCLRIFMDGKSQQVFAIFLVGLHLGDSSFTQIAPQILTKKYGKFSYQSGGFGLGGTLTLQWGGPPDVSWHWPNVFNNLVFNPSVYERHNRGHIQRGDLLAAQIFDANPTGWKSHIFANILLVDSPAAFRNKQASDSIVQAQKNARQKNVAEG